MTPTIPNSKPIRVLIVDDSVFIRSALTKMIRTDPGLQVVGTASNGVEALEQTQALQPDVITLDVEMPRMDGIEALGRIMAEWPRPVIMLSFATREGAETTLRALDIGAFDYITKPGSDGSLSIASVREDLIAKIKIAARSPLAPGSDFSRVLPAEPDQLPASSSARIQVTPTILAIGASTGGPKALQQVLSALPASLPVGVLVVQHMPPGFTAPFAERLNTLCQLRIREAAGGEIIEPGNVYIAPAGWHLTVSRGAAGRCSTEVSKSPSATLHRPSVDILLFSVAETFRSQAMGVLLTGMGVDGARGMKAIHKAGGWTVGQNAETCVVYGMPRAAAEMRALSRVAPLSLVATEIMSALSHSSDAAAPRATSHSAG